MSGVYHRLSLVDHREDEEVDARPDEHEGPHHAIVFRLLGEAGKTRNDEGSTECASCEIVHVRSSFKVQFSVASLPLLF